MSEMNEYLIIWDSKIIIYILIFIFYLLNNYSNLFIDLKSIWKNIYYVIGSVIFSITYIYIMFISDIIKRFFIAPISYQKYIIIIMILVLVLCHLIINYITPLKDYFINKKNDEKTKNDMINFLILIITTIVSFCLLLLIYYFNLTNIFIYILFIINFLIIEYTNLQKNINIPKEEIFNLLFKFIILFIIIIILCKNNHQKSLLILLLFININLTFNIINNLFPDPEDLTYNNLFLLVVFMFISILSVFMFYGQNIWAGSITLFIIIYIYFLTTFPKSRGHKNKTFTEELMFVLYALYYPFEKLFIKTDLLQIITNICILITILLILYRASIDNIKLRKYKIISKIKHQSLYTLYENYIK